MSWNSSGYVEYPSPSSSAAAKPYGQAAKPYGQPQANAYSSYPAASQAPAQSYTPAASYYGATGATSATGAATPYAAANYASAAAQAASYTAATAQSTNYANMQGAVAAASRYTAATTGAAGSASYLPGATTTYAYAPASNYAATAANPYGAAYGAAPPATTASTYGSGYAAPTSYSAAASAYGHTGAVAPRAQVAVAAAGTYGGRGPANVRATQSGLLSREKYAAAQQIANDLTKTLGKPTAYAPRERDSGRRRSRSRGRRRSPARRERRSRSKGRRERRSRSGGRRPARRSPPRRNAPKRRDHGRRDSRPISKRKSTTRRETKSQEKPKKPPVMPSGKPKNPINFVKGEVINEDGKPPAAVPDAAVDKDKPEKKAAGSSKRARSTSKHNAAPAAKKAKLAPGKLKLKGFVLANGGPGQAEEVHHLWSHWPEATRTAYIGRDRHKFKISIEGSVESSRDKISFSVDEENIISVRVVEELPIDDRKALWKEEKKLMKRVRDAEETVAYSRESVELARDVYNKSKDAEETGTRASSIQNHLDRLNRKEEQLEEDCERASEAQQELMEFRTKRDEEAETESKREPSPISLKVNDRVQLKMERDCQGSILTIKGNLALVAFEKVPPGGIAVPVLWQYLEKLEPAVAKTKEEIEAEAAAAVAEKAKRDAEKRIAVKKEPVEEKVPAKEGSTKDPKEAMDPPYLSPEQVKKMKVAQLRGALVKRGESTGGLKKDLLARLNAYEESRLKASSPSEPSEVSFVDTEGDTNVVRFVERLGGSIQLVVNSKTKYVKVGKANYTAPNQLEFHQRGTSYIARVNASMFKDLVSKIQNLCGRADVKVIDGTQPATKSADSPKKPKIKLEPVKTSVKKEEKTKAKRVKVKVPYRYRLLVECKEIAVSNSHGDILEKSLRREIGSGPRILLLDFSEPSSRDGSDRRPGQVLRESLAKPLEGKDMAGSWATGRGAVDLAERLLVQQRESHREQHACTRCDVDGAMVPQYRLKAYTKEVLPKQRVRSRFYPYGDDKVMRRKDLEGYYEDHVHDHLLLVEKFLYKTIKKCDAMESFTREHFDEFKVFVQQKKNAKDTKSTPAAPPPPLIKRESEPTPVVEAPPALEADTEMKSTGDGSKS